MFLSKILITGLHNFWMPVRHNLCTLFKFSIWLTLQLTQTCIHKAVGIGITDVVAARPI